MGCSYVRLLTPLELPTSTINNINDYNIHTCVSMFICIVFSVYLYHFFVSYSIYKSTKLLLELSKTTQAKNRMLEKL